MTDHAHHRNTGAHAHHDHAGLAETLTLDAQVLGEYLEQATQWAARLLPAPATIIDVGSGSGVGTVALGRQFGTAHLVALDKSDEMLHRTLDAARDQGLSGRVTGIRADLDGGWPATDPADLIWASSSLHELADPEKSMRDMLAGLNPGGLLVVIEMDTLPRFLPEDQPGDDQRGLGLESRLHAELARQDWNAHPDWREGLVRAGFDVIEQRSFPTEGRSTPELAARYAATFLGRMRQALDGIAAPEDQAALNRLLATDGPESLAHRTDLHVRGSRTAWAARKR